MRREASSNVTNITQGTYVPREVQYISLTTLLSVHTGSLTDQLGIYEIAKLTTSSIRDNAKGMKTLLYAGDKVRLELGS